MLIPPLLALAANGCAVDNYGAVLGRITYADGAVVADIHSLGAHLKTYSGDPGVVLGYSRASYVFADEVDQPRIAEGWQLFAVSLPRAEPLVVHVKSAGLSAHQVQSGTGMTLGYRVSTLLANMPAGANVVMKVRYAPDQPSRTQLRSCRENSKCAGLP